MSSLKKSNPRSKPKKSDVLQKTAKKMDMVFQEGHELFSKLISVIPDTVIVIDLTGKIIFINEPGVKTFGYSSPSKVIGRNVFDSIIQEQQKRAERGMARRLKGDIGIEEYQMIAKDGGLMPMEVDGNVIRNSDGSPVALVYIGRDISERRRVENALRESEEKYRQSFAQATDIVYTIDEEYRFASVSPSVERILGYKPEELVGKSIEAMTKVFAPESLEPVLSNSIRIMNGEHIPDAVYTFMAKDGTKKYGECNAAPLWRDGKIVGGIGVARDITDRKEAEEALLKSEQKYRAILDRSPNPILIRDNNKIILDANKQAIKFFGYSKKELIGQPAYMIWPPEELDRVNKAIETADLYGKGHIHNANVLRKDGRKVNVDASGSRFSVGDDVFYVLIFHDTTEHKEMQEQLQKAKTELESTVAERTRELMEANTALKVLLSHQNQEKAENEQKLTTNLRNQILPYLHELKKEKISADKRRAYLQLIEKNLQSVMSEFVTHLQSTTSKLTPKEIQVANLVKEGMSTKEIAQFLNVSRKTVDIFRHNIRKKLSLNKRRDSLVNYLLSL
jgi:PAS domain S-box-containing protein